MAALGSALLSVLVSACTLTPETVQLASNIASTFIPFNPTQGLDEGVTGPSVFASPTMTSVSFGTSSTGTTTLNITGTNLNYAALLTISPLPSSSGSPEKSCPISGSATGGGAFLKCTPSDSDVSDLLLSGFTLSLFTSRSFTTPAASYTIVGFSSGSSGVTYPLQSLTIGSPTPFFSVNGNTSIGSPSSSSTLQVVGSTSDSTSFALVVSGSNTPPLLQVRDDGLISMGYNGITGNTFNFNAPVTLSSTSTSVNAPALHITGNTSINGAFNLTLPSPSPSPLQFLQLSVTQPSPTADVDIIAPPPTTATPSSSSYAIRVEASSAQGMQPSPLFVMRNDGIAAIGAMPSAFPSPSDAPTGGLQVTGNIKINGDSLIVGGGPGFAISSTAPTFPACNSTRKGYLTLDYAKLPCVCNGTNWVSASDGQRGCFIHNATDCTAATSNGTSGIPQTAPNPAPSGWPSMPFCKFNGSSCPDGWKQYGFYSTTAMQCHHSKGEDYCAQGTCTFTFSCCNSPFHSWGNTNPATETCSTTSNTDLDVTGGPTITQFGCY